MSEKTLKGKAKREQDILGLMSSDPKISSAELAKTLQVTERTIERDIARLREENKIMRLGGDKGGEWVVLFLFIIPSLPSVPSTDGSFVYIIAPASHLTGILKSTI